MTPETKPAIPTQANDDDEIDLLALAKTVWNGRKLIIKTAIAGGILGLIVALVSPKEYTATTTIVPQTSSSSSKLGGLSSLAAMAGFNMDNLGNSTDALSPLVYPQIVSSAPFLLDLMNSQYTFTDVNHPVSLYEYYTNIDKPGVLSLVKKYTLGLPGVILSALKGEQKEMPNLGEKQTGPIQLTEKQSAIKKMLEGQVTLNLDSKQGFITLQASFPEALLSAQVADQACKLLQKYIIEFKIQKASSKLDFIEGRYQEKKKDFEKAQQNLARYRDQNKNVSSMIARTEEDRLQGEFSIALNVYNELAKQLEQAKIQVKEETPTFSVVQPAVVPIRKSKPNRPMILFVSLFLGGVAGIGWIFGKQFYTDMKIKWNENND